MKKVFSKLVGSLFIIGIILLFLLCFKHSSIAAEAEDLTQEGIGYYKKGALDTAIISLKEAIELEPNIIEAHYYLGLAYEDKEMYEDAVKAYKKVREISTDMSSETAKNAARHLVDIYRKERMVDEMMNFIKEASQHSKDIPPDKILRMHYGLGQSYRMKEMYAESIDEFEKVIQIQPDFNPDIYYYLGCNYNYLSDREKAIQNLKKYLELAPDGVFANETKELIKQLSGEETAEEAGATKEAVEEGAEKEEVE